jgi:hypothetical protein
MRRFVNACSTRDSPLPLQCTHVLIVDHRLPLPHHQHAGGGLQPHAEPAHLPAIGGSGGLAGIKGASRLPLSPAFSDSLIADVVVAMARETLRTLGLAFRDFPGGVKDLPPGWERAEDAGSLFEGGLTLYGIFGIKDPLRKVRAETASESLATAAAS